MTRSLAFALLSAATVACAPTSESVLEDAAEAMGGKEAVLATNTLVLEGTGQTYRTGQNKSPDADLPVFELHSYKKEMDLENGRWRADHSAGHRVYLQEHEYGGVRGRDAGDGGRGTILQ